ncbi:MAG: right-handed parallel beta-helix repeat-containing protein [Methanothrix sp.]|nr:right-handed parallel beta-helix repeat-containing protein [Methanothrix sp.]
MSYKNLWRMIIAVYAVVALAGGGTITVCSSGCDYSSPKAAIFAAREGDVVEVMSGRYYDHQKIDKKIVLLGVDSGGGKPVLDATGYASPITVTADGVVVEGLRLMNGGPGSAGILVVSSGNVIVNNDASNNYVGVRLVGSNNSKVQGNVASGNLEYGIVLEGSFGNVISDNVILKNFIGNAFDDGTNRWDDGSVGNRYGDFDDPEEGCIDADLDGICDRGREIPGGSNLDRFPRAAG